MKPPGWRSLFPPFFASFFDSLFPFHPVSMFLSFLKGRISPQMFKKDWGEFF
jgi:hypothetical protein